MTFTHKDLQALGYTLVFVPQMDEKDDHYCLSGKGQMIRFKAVTMNAAMDEAKKIITGDRTTAK